MGTHDDGIKVHPGEELVGKVEGQGYEEADDDREGNDEVGSSGAVHGLGERSPGLRSNMSAEGRRRGTTTTTTHDGLRVVRLYLLSRPDVGSLHRGEEVALSGDDALHLRVETCQ
jgi:hypothetical protein